MEQGMIYMDNNATTCVDPEVVDAMRPYFGEHYANPSSPYGPGRRVARAIWEARESVAGLVGADPGQVIFTSGGTEANNLALHAALAGRPDRDRVLVSAVEHASVLTTAQRLAARTGRELVTIPVDKDGALDMNRFCDALDGRVALVSLMLANNETGVLFPLQEASVRAREVGARVHCDAVQAAGKLPLDQGDIGVDLLTISSHKLHGPKGIGALSAAPDLVVEPLILGGGQEGGRRGGTENVAAMVGFGAAAMRVDLDDLGGRVRGLRDRLEAGLLNALPDCRVSGGGATRLPQTSNLVFAGIEAEALIALLDLEGICCSTGSACAAGSPEPSHVLAAMGLDPASMGASVRFGLSRFSTDADVDAVLDAVVRHVSRLRAG